MTMIPPYDEPAEQTDEVGGRGTHQDAQRRPPPCRWSFRRCSWSIQWPQPLVQLPPDRVSVRSQ